MRLVAVLLLVANVVVAGYFFLADRKAPVESDPSHQQINPDRIRVVATGSEAVALMRPKGSEDPQRPAPLSCATWGGFQEAQAAAAEARLAALELGPRLSRSEATTASSYLVLIPPIPRRVDLNGRVAELIRTGVTDQFVINDGEFRNGISLGFFKSEEAANRHLDQLKAKGVNDAVVRPRPSGSRTVTLAMRDLSNVERSRLETIAGEFAGVELRIQGCPAAGSPG
jgi:hypothetical protein